MKKKLLLTSILSIVMCFSLIVGATFALFTSESTVNVAVTSGKVKVTATVDGFEYKTLNKDWTVATDNKTVFDDIGGSAELKDGTITLDKIVPGDAVKFTVKITNESDVKVMCRTSVRNLSESSSLFKALKVTVNDEDFTTAKISNWTEVAPETTDVATFNIVIELPEDTPSVTIDGVNIMGETAKLQIMVEAIQGNAETSDDVPVSTAGELQEALALGKPIALSEDLSLDQTFIINGDVTINGGGKTITRAQGFTGTIFNVTAGASLTLNDVIIDSSAIVQQATGYSAGTYNSNTIAPESVIVAGNNSEIVLGEGVKIMNHKGSYVIHLGTRIGATLVIDGAEITNCTNSSGVIWGGGNITLNSGKINNNYSTGSAGVIRMVSKCSFTMNGGEINYNVAEGDGGVFWGYGDGNGGCTYMFNGGEIAYNESKGTAGVLVPGEYANVYINGDFEMHDNKDTYCGAIRFNNYNNVYVNGGKIYNNTANGKPYAIWAYQTKFEFRNGEILDPVYVQSGRGLYIGATKFGSTFEINIGTNHNNVNLIEGFDFTFKNVDADFGVGNDDGVMEFIPYDGYVYTEGDESRIVCVNEGFVVEWDEVNKQFIAYKSITE